MAFLAFARKFKLAKLNDNTVTGWYETRTFASEN